MSLIASLLLSRFAMPHWLAELIASAILVISVVVVALGIYAGATHWLVLTEQRIATEASDKAHSEDAAAVAAKTAEIQQAEHDDMAARMSRFNTDSLAAGDQWSAAEAEIQASETTDVSVLQPEATTPHDSITPAAPGFSGSFGRSHARLSRMLEDASRF